MLLPVLMLVCFYNLGSYWGEAVIDNGVIYWHGAAIQKDREIAEEFAGALTEETVLAIWERYGPPVNFFDRSTTYDHLEQVAAGGGNDNYCNNFVARMFCDRITDEEGNMILALREDISDSPYLQGGYTFGYVGNGWEYFWDYFLLSWLMACLVTIIGLCPTFSEDYSFRTADILLPTVKGRFSLWRTRLIVGSCFASAYYWFLGITLFIEQWCFYGFEGLQVSNGITFGYYFNMDTSAPLWKVVLFLYMSSWLAILVLNALVLAASALCKKSFTSLIWSLGLFLGPFAFLRVVLDQLPMTRLLMWVKTVIYSLPLSYAGMCQNAPFKMVMIMTGVEAAAGVMGVLMSVKGWCRHQVEG